MTDARFLSNNSVTREANHVTFESLTQDYWAYKRPSNFSKLVKGVAHYGMTLYQKVEIFDIFGAAFPPGCGD